MADIVVKKGAEAEAEPKHKIRITLSGTQVAPLEKVCSDVKAKAKNNKIDVKGPVRLPTQVLRVTVRKSPCGEGTNTFDRFQMRVHKRIIDLVASSNEVKEITKLNIEPGVDVEIVIAE